jgi:hypothetical protein
MYAEACLRQKLWPRTKHRCAHFHCLRDTSKFFIACALFNDAVSRSDCIASGDRMNNELERMWKEAVVVRLKLLSWD